MNALYTYCHTIISFANTTRVMDKNILLIKNMVCNRCIMAVEDILQRRGIPYTNIHLGELHTAQPLSEKQKDLLSKDLQQIGFGLIDNKTGGMIEKIKRLVIKRARNEVSEDDSRLKLSTYLSAQLHHEYTYLSNLFSSVESRTIENYFIEQRIEYVKELLVYGELTLSQIAMKLEYSSTAHLSGQFKKVTGLTPSHYKQIGQAKRKTLDEI